MTRSSAVAEKMCDALHRQLLWTEFSNDMKHQAASLQQLSF